MSEVIPSSSPIPETPSKEISETSTPSNTSPSKLDEGIAFLRDIVIILLLVIFVRSYLAAPFRISGSSMEENYHDGEFIIVNKATYLDLGFTQFGNPKRGDVVVIKPHADIKKDFYIKRIIGLPGDEIKIDNGFVFLKKPGTKDFIQLNETYLSPANFGKTLPGRSSKDSSYLVPDGQYFLLGDNRNGSSDSRDCFYSCTTGNTTHFIHRSDIVGDLWATLGSVKIFENFDIFPPNISLAKNIGVDIAPRFLSTPRNWDYKELN
ncbi:MAG: signal peptidase I [Patescibacteria group bacterium]